MARNQDRCRRARAILKRIIMPNTEKSGFFASPFQTGMLGFMTKTRPHGNKTRDGKRRPDQRVA